MLGLSLFLSLLSFALAQWYQTHNLTPDGYWHNRYFMLLSMASYGNYSGLCPVETFTEEAMLRNFPDSTRPPWTLVDTFGPTPSGCSGFMAVIPEMNKALIIFSGNLELEQNIPTEVTSWDAIGLGDACPSCTVNAFAAQGYMEAKNVTNNFQAIREAYAGAGLVFAIAGHGLGGMHSQIASVDFYQQNICYYSHAYGSPRVFNPAGAEFYNIRFNGEAGERGVAQNDLITEIIPESENYTHAGTPFHYYGYNSSSTGMNWEICWLEDNVGYEACKPRPYGNSTSLQDHYFYFTNVADCGGQNRQNTSAINSFLSKANPGGDASVSSVTAGVTSSSSSSLIIPTSTEEVLTSTDTPATSTTALPAATTASSTSGSTKITESGSRVISIIIITLAFFFMI